MPFSPWSILKYHPLCSPVLLLKIEIPVTKSFFIVPFLKKNIFIVLQTCMSVLRLTFTKFCEHQRRANTNEILPFHCPPNSLLPDTFDFLLTTCAYWQVPCKAGLKRGGVMSMVLFLLLLVSSKLKLFFSLIFFFFSVWEVKQVHFEPRQGMQRLIVLGLTGQVVWDSIQKGHPDLERLNLMHL